MTDTETVLFIGLGSQKSHVPSKGPSESDCVKRGERMTIKSAIDMLYDSYVIGLLVNCNRSCWVRDNIRDELCLTRSCEVV